ncbi:MAG: N-acetylmuramic acid 6-phosphate etherase [Emcibacteraceae bacterium]|nr:N-acetylmuramic acid 6-phosphate etherase [Emcibacteraceae bacterium]
MTENISQRFSDFDQWTTQNMIEAMYDGQLVAIAAIKSATNAIAIAADEATTRLGKNGRLVYVGAGTSGRLSVQDGVELGPTFGWPEERLVFCLAGGMDAMTKSAEGAEDDLNQGAEQMRKAAVNKNDVVIGVAASGSTPFTLGALREANALGALTIGITNNPDTSILQEAMHPILAETGSELIAGSTRMKAGTAQKAILNMLSTAIMSKLGRVYKGLMVDMIVSNEKLENRAVNMISDIASCTHEKAISALKKADKNIKLAVLISMGESYENSQHMLEKTKGNLRNALKILEET